jgi:uncharacterized membrane protein (UPF0127 family)
VRRRPSGWLIAAVGMLVVGGGLATFAIVRAVTDHDCPASAEGTSLEDALVLPESADEPFPGLTAARIAVGSACLSVVVVDEPEERAAGLRGRADLGAYDGMLFVNDADVTTTYTMEGVPVPLDIGFYATNGDVVDRLRMVPCETGADCPSYQAQGSYRFALETLAGDLPEGRLAGCPASM